ncbi:hypothetical protein NIES4071_69730 [Calothrix sp. NIES-4071]|nr:hypothetical protein NIES4071_69730 [Calothrix sp. NIES-4071]BAZ61250.1 hypothetical protein NIES4105_69680 [Calothrix sp. NIES-4105]
MLKTIHVVKTPSTERLLNLWAQRYTLDLGKTSNTNLLSDSVLLDNACLQGRASTAKKLKDSILTVNCQMGWIQTKTLYAYIPNVVDLAEARRITQFAFRVYKKLIDVYQTGNYTDEVLTQDKRVAFKLPAIQELAYALEPTLLIFQEQHIASKDWRALGFMTTQLNFTNKLITKKLEPVERVLLAPYLKFVEEQVAIPWQRVCGASEKHSVDSAEFRLVEEMLPQAPSIAWAVYNRLLKLLPDYRTRRGHLGDEDIAHSCIRDLNMFQAYLWLCLFEGNIAPIQLELLPLCAMVVQGVNIKWELTEKWWQVLEQEIFSRVTPQAQQLIMPYSQQIQELFWSGRDRLGYQEDNLDARRLGEALA